MLMKEDQGVGTLIGTCLCNLGRKRSTILMAVMVLVLLGNYVSLNRDKARLARELKKMDEILATNNEQQRRELGDPTGSQTATGLQHIEGFEAARASEHVAKVITPDALKLNPLRPEPSVVLPEADNGDKAPAVKTSTTTTAATTTTEATSTTTATITTTTTTQTTTTKKPTTPSATPKTSSAATAVKEAPRHAPETLKPDEPDSDTEYAIPEPSEQYEGFDFLSRVTPGDGTADLFRKVFYYAITSTNDKKIFTKPVPEAEMEKGAAMCRETSECRGFVHMAPLTSKEEPKELFNEDKVYQWITPLPPFEIAVTPPPANSWICVGLSSLGLAVNTHHPSASFVRRTPFHGLVGNMMINGSRWQMVHEAYKAGVSYLQPVVRRADQQANTTLRLDVQPVVNKPEELVSAHCSQRPEVPTTNPAIRRHLYMTFPTFYWPCNNLPERKKAMIAAVVEDKEKKSSAPAASRPLPSLQREALTLSPSLCNDKTHAARYLQPASRSAVAVKTASSMAAAARTFLSSRSLSFLAQMLLVVSLATAALLCFHCNIRIPLRRTISNAAAMRGSWRAASQSPFRCMHSTSLCSFPTRAQRFSPLTHSLPFSASLLFVSSLFFCHANILVDAATAARGTVQQLAPTVAVTTREAPFMDLLDVELEPPKPMWEATGPIISRTTRTEKKGNYATCRVTNVCFNTSAFLVFADSAADFDLTLGAQRGDRYNYHCDGPRCACFPAHASIMVVRPPPAAKDLKFLSSIKPLIVNVWPKDTIQYGHHVSKLVFALQILLSDKFSDITHTAFVSNPINYEGVLLMIYSQMLMQKPLYRLAGSDQYTAGKWSCFEEAYLSAYEESIGLSKMAVAEMRHLFEEVLDRGYRRRFFAPLNLSVPCPTKKKAVILQRGQGLGRRNFENLNTLAHFLVDRGYWVSVFYISSDRDMMDIVHRISSSSLVIAPHGSHLKNILFAVRNTIVIETVIEYFSYSMSPGTKEYDIIFRYSEGHGRGYCPSLRSNAVYCNIVFNATAFAAVLDEAEALQAELCNEANATIAHVSPPPVYVPIHKAEASKLTGKKSPPPSTVLL